MVVGSLNNLYHLYIYVFYVDRGGGGLEDNEISKNIKTEAVLTLGNNEITWDLLEKNFISYTQRVTNKEVDHIAQNLIQQCYAISTVSDLTKDGQCHKPKEILNE